MRLRVRRSLSIRRLRLSHRAKAWCHRHTLRGRRYYYLHSGRAVFTFLFLLGVELEITSRIVGLLGASAFFRELRFLRNKADLLLIEYVVTAVKHLRPVARPVARRIQEITQRRNRAIMKIRRTQPDTIERAIGVAEGLVKMSEPPGIAGVNGA